ncbi:hypothetical protein LTR37_012371 [Vermiconidia calcicola]|uniref:Uncharacterized protein n=1 Tax=Vermiconidia calcicola TaxID=1690605 RepID=A0ACC3MZF1_9PEZI|nr:hypothetical protein LTR37_012371 [Vermiconidia calcicola]
MPPHHSRKRAASSELGEGDFGISFNAQTGRPVRKARRTLENSPFVNSATISDATDNSDCSDTIPVVRRRKRKRSPSPPPSYESSEVEVVARSSSPDVGTPAISTGESIQITLQNVVVNVPIGHVGPVMLQLDLPPLISGQPRAMPQASKTHRRPLHHTITTTPHQSGRSSKSKNRNFAGFLDLPAELRNEIYQQVFVVEESFRFDSPSNFSRCAALLRTCKQVYEEGRSILYSANHFIFARKTRRHGSYWQPEWSEVGFKAVRKFLKIIGPTNIGLIRRATLLLEDATPCLNPDLTTADDRRFVYDDVLMSVLRQLTDYAKLEKLDLHFHGRRRVERTDHRFLDNLTTIQADQVSFVPTPWTTLYPSDSKQESVVEKLCLKAMTRKKKLYA